MISYSEVRDCAPLPDFIGHQSRLYIVVRVHRGYTLFVDKLSADDVDEPHALDDLDALSTNVNLRT